MFIIQEELLATSKTYIYHGTIVYVPIERKININQAGHTQNFVMKNLNTQVSAGIRINLGKRKKKKKVIDF